MTLSLFSWYYLFWVIFLVFHVFLPFYWVKKMSGCHQLPSWFAFWFLQSMRIAKRMVKGIMVHYCPQIKHQSWYPNKWNWTLLYRKLLFFFPVPKYSMFLYLRWELKQANFWSQNPESQKWSLYQPLWPVILFYQSICM